MRYARGDPILGCCCYIIEHVILLMVTSDIRVAMTASTGIKVTKAIAK